MWLDLRLKQVIGKTINICIFKKSNKGQMYKKSLKSCLAAAGTELLWGKGRTNWVNTGILGTRLEKK